MSSYSQRNVTYGQQKALPSNINQKSAVAPTRNMASNELIESMKKNMADELEQRRLAWEKDVTKLQEDFFKVKLGDVTSSGSSGGDHKAITYGEETKPVDRGDRMLSESVAGGLYMLRFNLRDYSPEDISVRVEDEKLVLTAKHIEGEGTQSKVTRQFNKQIDIPANVQIEKIVSYLSADGVLTVEAPISGDKPTYKAVMHESQIPTSHYTVRDYNRPEKSDIKHQQQEICYPYAVQGNELELYGSSARPAEIVSPFLPICAGATNIVDTEYGKILKLEVDLGKTDYKPNEVKVKVFPNKLVISASHEEINRGRTSRREFQREFEIPEPIAMQTLRAMLDVNKGIVFIGAGFVSNTKPSMVLYLITQQMPVLGRQCAIEHY